MWLLYRAALTVPTRQVRVMAGMEVVVVKCDDQGEHRPRRLKKQAEKHSDNLSALMVTYPSTHGVLKSLFWRLPRLCTPTVGRFTWTARI